MVLVTGRASTILGAAFQHSRLPILPHYSRLLETLSGDNCQFDYYSESSPPDGIILLVTIQLIKIHSFYLAQLNQPLPTISL